MGSGLKRGGETTTFKLQTKYQAEMRKVEEDKRAKMSLADKLPKLRLQVKRHKGTKVLPSKNIYEISKLGTRKEKQREILRDIETKEMNLMKDLQQSQ